MARQALAATQNRDGRGFHLDFLNTKVVTARFYCEQLRPHATGLLAAVTAGAADLLALAPAQF